MLLRCFTSEADLWKEAYPEQAKTQLYPYTRQSLLLECYEALTAHPFVPNGQGYSLTGILSVLKERLVDRTSSFSLC